MPPSLPNPDGAEASVLLIEEYAALAAAIGAALKKFAPTHRVQRVRTLADALEAALLSPPALLILDFDPPFPGVLDFLNELRLIAPAARVIIIAAALPQELLRDDRLPTAFTFVEKPYQLAEFGAAVSRLTSVPAAGDPSSRFVLGGCGLADVIPLLAIEGVTGMVSVTAAEGALAGEVWLARGTIPHATASGLQGIDALREMLRWPTPDFEFEEGACSERSLEGKWPTVLDRVLRSIPRPTPARRVSKKAGRRPVRKTAPAPVAPQAKTGRKILVIDDTETLRIFVEEMLSTTDPSLQITLAANGSEGLERCASFQPDLILLDYSLPDFNGDEVCRRLLADAALRDTPVLMMSGHVAQMAEAAARFQNIVRTLSKPFVSAELIAAVQEVLARPRGEPRPQVPAPVLETAAASVMPEPRIVPQLEPTNPTVRPPPAIVPAQVPAHLAVASSDAVLVSIGLEVVAMQFSSNFQITTLQARPTSSAVLLHVDPRAVSSVPLPEVAFEIAEAQLDARGQLHALRIVPAAQPPSALPPHAGVSIERLALVPANGHSGLQLIPAPSARMSIQLMAAFDLAGVELSPTFGVSHFALRSRSGRMRATLPGQRGTGGSIFEATRIVLDARGRIAEIELSVAAQSAAPVRQASAA